MRVLFNYLSKNKPGSIANLLNSAKLEILEVYLLIWQFSPVNPGSQIHLCVSSW